jgi:uncharacterized protein YprB with RNaseH-like and TPR domain
MNAIADKLSRVAALRPNARTLAPSISKSDQLIQQMGGEKRINDLGSHIAFRSCFTEPQPKTVDIQTLRFLSPEAPDSSCDLGQWLFLDTETTGLAGGTGTYAFLVGLAWWEKDGFVVEQFFMKDHSEEPSLLLGISDHLARRPILVTFNGKSFDWPLLQTRYQMTRAGAVPSPRLHLDLLHPSRQLWRLRLQSVALTQLETYVLKLNRGQDIPSETIPQIYFDFLRGGRPEPMAEVFRHNQLDLCGLASLALHVCHILADPENRDCCAEDLFGMSRLLQRRGAHDLAGRIYRKALAGGLAAPAEQIAQRELALLAKRGQDYNLSNSFWEKLLGDTVEGLNAYEQLAIYYEHKARLPGKAALLVRESILKLQEAFRAGRISSGKYMQLYEKFQYRLARLNKKLQYNL